MDRLGEHAAFRLFIGPGPELSPLSYRETFARVKEVAGALRVLGLERG